MKTIKLNDVSVEVTKEQLEEALAKFNKPEIKYPICCRYLLDSYLELIVLFSSEKRGIILYSNDEEIFEVGTTHSYTSHTDPTTWEQIPYDAERGLYHKQPVYCWDKDDPYEAVLRFYDAENKCSFDSFGTHNGYAFDNYSATIPDHMKEFKEPV